MSIQVEIFETQTERPRVFNNMRAVTETIMVPYNGSVRITLPDGEQIMLFIMEKSTKTAYLEITHGPAQTVTTA